MSERIKMNSENLQKCFPEIYKGFFSKCSIVTSAPYFFYWAGEYSMSFGAPTISQKIPLRVYVGLEKTSKGDIEFGDSFFFSPAEGEFQKFDHDYSNNQKFLGYLKEIVKKLDDGKGFRGYRINMIFEVPLYSGLNATSALLSSLVAAVALDLKKISLEEYKKMAKTPVSELIESSAFDFIFREAWKLNSSVRYGISSGSSIFSCLASSRYPLVYFSESKGKKGSHISYNVTHDIDEIDKLKYWAFDIGKFFGLESNPVWAVDFGLIYSGSPKHSARITHTLAQMDEYLSEVNVFVEKSFGKSKKADIPGFIHDDFKGSGVKEFRDNYISSLSFLTVDIVRSLRETFLKGSDEALANLFRSINLYDNIIYSLNDNFNSVRYIRGFIKEDIKNNTDGVGVATKVCGLGRGGDIIFVAPYGVLRNHIYQAKEEIAKNIGKEVVLDYLSWEDGHGENGLIVNQFIEESVYSKFISRDVVRVSTLDDNGVLQSSIVANDSLGKEITEVDLLLDNIKGDVYIRGKALGSKEIFSAKYTVEFLSILLKSNGDGVGNKDLPRSSYSTNRNEFQSKILVPIQKEIKKRTKRDLIIEISGKTDDFTLRLKATDCNICFLEKVF